MVNDSPITIGKWTPKNSDGRYLGMIPLRRALYLSRNTVSVRLLQMVGIERTRQLLMDFGLQENQIPRNYTIALGTPQVLPVQMATGYAAFANGGYRIQPHFISRIEDAYGKVIYQANPEYACIQCINEKEPAPESDNPATPDDEAFQVSNSASEATSSDSAEVDTGDYRQAQRILKSSSAFDMANILRDVIQHGTGRAALKIGRNDLGGKTGTTNDAKDAWFAGFNGKLVSIAWVGFDQPTTLGRREYGGVAALPIWTNFMENALKGTPESWVRFDKNAKLPVQRGQAVPNKDANKQDRAAPALAQPVYRPTPVAPRPTVQNDFEDLPGDQPLVPNQTKPPALNNNPPPKQGGDALDHLIQQVQ